MSLRAFWWSRFGSYAPGLYNLPHTGEVIANHRRKRGYRTQDAFAIAAGVDKRTVQEWESCVFTHDHERRIFLAKMLKITPALLGLDWRQVVFEDNTGTYHDPLSSMIELLEEDAYYAYEDILILGHDSIHNGGPPDIAYRVDRRLKKLVQITKHARSSDEEAWKTLLCRYYQLSTRIKQQCQMDHETALHHAQHAIELAMELQDSELIASALVNSVCTYTQQEKLDQARQAITGALDYVDKVRNGPLKGNIYLEAANITTPFARNESKLQDQCKTWQTKAANMLYKGNLEADESFFKFNLSAVHHEKARSLLQWQKTREDRKGAHSKVITALETLSPDLTVWKAYYSMTEAHLYLADHDIEGSAKAGKAALNVAKAMHSKMEEEQVRKLYDQLNQLAPLNPYTRNLGLELGIF